MQIVKNINNKRETKSSLSVLLAEEHPLSAEIERKNLELAGFSVYITNTLNETLHFLTQNKVDLLIADKNFSRKNIQTYLNKIRDTSLNSNIKIILYSVKEQKIQKPNIEKPDLYLIKPIAKERLIQQIKTLFLLKIRNTNRILVNLETKIEIEKNNYQGEITDICINGFHFINKKSRIKKHIGTLLKAEINLPRFKKPIIVTGVLIRKTIEGYGVKILDISNENSKKLKKYIEQKGKGTYLETYYL
jgi:response regulator RpfG family c-di-GMP phosphodiesterase